MTYPAHVRVVEVGPRDGLQNETPMVATETRVALIEALADAGLASIEAGSFVSPKWVPRMADTAEVMSRLRPRAGVRYSVLVPNQRGLEQALACGAREVAVFTAASESFCRRNTNCSIAESLDRFAPIVDAARTAGLRVRGYLSCVLGCPYEGEVSADVVARLAGRLRALGCDEISLGDTIGVGTPLKARRLVERVASKVAIDQIAVHFHDTYGQALANLLACLELGVSIVDSAVAGLGGCPYAPGATGNVATEDVVYMLHGMGIETGIDLAALARAGTFITAALNRVPASNVTRAMAAARKT